MAVQIGMSVGESKLMMSIKISNVPLTLGIPRVGTKCIQDGSLGPVRTGWWCSQACGEAVTPLESAWERKPELAGQDTRRKAPLSGSYPPFGDSKHTGMCVCKIYSSIFSFAF